MKTILAAALATATVAFLAAVTPAHARLTMNSLTSNGLQPQGLEPNGLSPQGLDPNVIDSNGVKINGIKPNAASINGMVEPTGLRILSIELPTAGLSVDVPRD